MFIMIKKNDDIYKNIKSQAVTRVTGNYLNWDFWNMF